LNFHPDSWLNYWGRKVSYKTDRRYLKFENEVKPQLVVGGTYLITGRILATVGDWGKNKMAKPACLPEDGRMENGGIFAN